MFKISNVSHVYYSVWDLDKTIDFFTKALGCSLLRRYSTSPGRESAYITIGDTLIELSMAAEGTPRPSRNIIGLAVDDLDQALADLQAKGVEVATAPFAARTFWGRQAVIKDPNGHQIALREWRAPDGPHYPDWKPDQEGVTRIA